MGPYFIFLLLKYTLQSSEYILTQWIYVLYNREMSNLKKCITFRKYNVAMGGVMRRPKMMHPHMNFLGPLVPKINRPGNIMSLD